MKGADRSQERDRWIETRRQEIEFFIVEFTVNRFNAL